MTNMTRRNLEGIAVLSVAILLLAFGLIWSARSTPGNTDQYPLDKACYAVIGRDGTEYKSWYPPVPAAGGPSVFTFNNDHTWGYVFAPNAMIADRDCLRERYEGQPDLVPPLEGSDD